MKNHLKLNLLYLLIFTITIIGCGSDMNTSSNDTGSAAFSIKWETPQNLNNMSLRDLSLPKGEAISELSYAPIDCTAIGVFTVSANVYDSGGTYITSGGPWNCTDHSGTITGISVGINRMITVNGKDSSNRIIYNGQITGVTIDKDQTTNAGQVTMTYVASDTTAPTDGTLSASAGNSQISLSWSGFSDSGSGIGSYKLVYSATSIPSSCSSGTQIWTGAGTSYTHTGLTNNTTYYYRVCAIDNAGNTSGGVTASGTPTASGTTTNTTTITTTGGTTTTTDTTAPSSPAVSINSGASSTTTTSVTLTLSATDNIGVTAYYASETSTTPSTSASGWTSVTSTISYSVSVSFTLSCGSSTKTVYVWFKDAAGNVSAPVSDSITLSTVTDIDCNVYNTVTIGTQVWMKENLKVTKYRNGNVIPTTTSSIAGETSPKYQWAYNNNESNVSTYGRLYTWYAATDSSGLCPTGWHLPTDTEWTTITDYLGGSIGAGGKMKEAGTTHWLSPNTSANNSSGFTALPGGYRSNSGTFSNFGYYGYWWSATEYDVAIAWYRNMGFNNSDVNRYGFSKDTGISVRCIRD